MKRAGVALAGLFSCLAVVAGDAAAELERGFSTPPMEARPRCWWHWMDRNISKEGITKDLEAMASVGIGGATILDVACFGVDGDDNRVKGSVRTLSPEWFGCVQHALAEAHRLGLTLSVANCPGWSSSGGPWIRPEHAMKNLGCTTVTVEGGRHLSLKLAQCHLEKGWGKDVAVLACPAVPGDGYAFMDDVVRITVLHDPDLKLPKPAEDYIHFTTDGNVLRNPKWTEQILFNPRLSKKPQGLVFELRRPVRMCGVDVALSGPPWGNKAKYRISVSEDGKAWTEHVTTPFIVKGGGVAAFPPVTSRFFKLEPLECGWLPVMGVDFTPAMRIPRLKEKAYYVHDTFDKFPTFARETGDCPPEFAIDPARTVDVTQHMKPDGSFEWDAPAGRWTICRFMTYARQSGNHPANPEGRGLECDKLSAAGVDEVWRGMMAPIAAAAKKAGTGEALRYTLVDSYEVGPQNWTDDMVAQFKARRGYDPTPYLPVMTGRYVKDSETSERFLEDVRRTVSDLFADVYGDYFRRKANKDGILLEIEPYGGPFDELRQGRSADIPMGEFWAGPTWGVGNAKLASNVADVNGRTYVQTETFTAGGRAAAWKSVPAHHKKQGDFAFCEGVNRFVFHSYAHQSFETTGPGMTMGYWGFMFNRHNTLWPYYGGWLSYVGRAQFMLQQGRSVGDVLYVVKEDTPCTPDWRPETPFGYRANAVDAEMFLRDVRADGAELALPCGQRYRVLVLPRTEIVSPAILEKAAACARSGVQVLLGPRPLRSFGLRDAAAADVRVRALADALWNGLDERTKSKPEGKGRVWLGARVADLLAAASMRPDFESVDRTTCPSAVTEPSKARVRFTHRTLPDREIYFVANVGEGPVAFTGRFRAQGAVELWDAEKGTHAPAPVWSARADGMTDVDLSLSNAESVFVVFRRDVSPAERVGRRVAVSRETASVDVSGGWTARFETSRGGPAHEVTFAKLASLSENADPSIRYYSGTVAYRRVIEMPQAWSDGQVFLDFGKVCDAARVFVNGKEVGTTWHAPHRVELTGVLKVGANELVVKVGNRWINRLIGDEEAPLPAGDRWVDKGEIKLLSSPTLSAALLEGKQPEGRFAYGTCRPYKKGEKLVPSGLIGPVRLTLWTIQSKNEDKCPVCKIGFLTDTHLRPGADEINDRTRKAFEVFKAQGVDAIGHCGDLADLHYPEMYDLYRSFVEKTYPDETKRPQLLYVYANHDLIDVAKLKAGVKGDSRQMPFEKGFREMKSRLGIGHWLFHSTEVKGVPVVVLPQIFEYEGGIARVERMLEEACAAHPTGPVVVLSHLAPAGTVYGSERWGYWNYRQVLERFPRVISFSGHTHNSLRNPAAFWQGAFSAVDVGCLEWWYGREEDGSDGGFACRAKSAYGVPIAEFYPDRVVIRRYDVRDGLEIGADYPWTVRQPYAGRPSAPRGGRVPRFADGAKLSVVERGGKVVLTFPPAEREDDVLSYRIEASVRVDGGWRPLVKGGCYSQFYLRPSERKDVCVREIARNAFQNELTYRFAVTPVGAGGTEGPALQADLTTR